ncbi:hypothetical protein BC830DRAFT_617542 [Chytriomyces sp. MP71]|nr:hypothetical protein BC830DRAFT_617542 [Chytriomyces sp. MP71]
MSFSRWTVHKQNIRDVNILTTEDGKDSLKWVMPFGFVRNPQFQLLFNLSSLEFDKLNAKNSSRNLLSLVVFSAALASFFLTTERCFVPHAESLLIQWFLLCISVASLQLAIYYALKLIRKQTGGDCLNSS